MVTREGCANVVPRDDPAYNCRIGFTCECRLLLQEICPRDNMPLQQHPSGHSKLSYRLSTTSSWCRVASIAFTESGVAVARHLPCKFDPGEGHRKFYSDLSLASGQFHMLPLCARSCVLNHAKRTVQANKRTSDRKAWSQSSRPDKNSLSLRLATAPWRGDAANVETGRGPRFDFWQNKRTIDRTNGRPPLPPPLSVSSSFSI